MSEIYRSQFRMPYELYEQLKESADKNRRSVNAELIARLEESFSPASHRIVRAVGPATQSDGAELEDIELNLEIILEQVKHLAATKPRLKLGRPLGIDQSAWAEHKAKENENKQ